MNETRSILERALEHVNNPLGRELLEAQNARGLAKYGQTLDSNDALFEEKLIHYAQEIADGMMYLVWLGNTGQSEIGNAHFFLSMMLDDAADMAQRLGIASLTPHDKGVGRVAQLEAEIVRMQETAQKAVVELEEYRRR